MARRRGCKYGKLKHKIGNRRCKLRPSKRGRASAAGRREAKLYRRDLEREVAHKAQQYLNGLRRRRR